MGGDGVAAALREAREQDEATAQRLKATLHVAIGAICEERAKAAGAQVSKRFIAALTETVFVQAERLGVDLESFAKHGKRSVVNVDDVKLCTRHNKVVTDMLQDYLDSLPAAPAAKKAKRGADALADDE